MEHLICKKETIDIPEDDPFKNDKLNRLHTKEVLRNIVDIYGESGCVLALNGEWGSGKTTFVNMWKQFMTKEGYQTLYFNAWTSDYIEDPLIAMMSELKEISPENKTFNKLTTYIGRVMLSSAKGVVKKLTGIDGEIFENTADEITKIGQEYLKDFDEQKKELTDFKKNLSHFIAEKCENHPLVFIIDELDRCNPHYAVSVLERIKHLFDIPNIIFILAINKVELSNAIQGYYGSDRINTDEYLRRFIDIEYTLPQPNIEEFCNYLYSQFHFDQFFLNAQRREYFGVREIDTFQQISYQMCQETKATLRQIDKIYAYTRLALMQFSANTYLLPDIYFLLCFWKILDDEFYKEIKNKELTIQELLNKLEQKLPAELLKTDEFNEYPYIYKLIASLIYCYDTTSLKDTYTQRPSLKKDNYQIEDNNFGYNIKCNILNVKKLNNTLIIFYEGHHNEYSNGLRYIFERIELFQSFQ